MEDNRPLLCNTEEDGFFISLLPLKVSSSCQIRKISLLTTIASGLLIRHLHPDFSRAALSIVKSATNKPELKSKVALERNFTLM